MSSDLTRRGMIAGGAALAPALAPTLAFGQGAPPGAAPRAPSPNAVLGQPATVVSNPPRIWGEGAPPNIFPDPDILVVDPAFGRLRMGQAVIKRVATGYQWAAGLGRGAAGYLGEEGPAWSAEGQYVVFSDVKGDVQYRYSGEAGEVTPF